MMERLSIYDVAQELRVSVSWVYANAHLLGTKLGGMWFFTKEGVEDAIRRREPMEGSGPVSRHKRDEAIRHKKGRVKVGKGSPGGISEDIIADAKRHGLIGAHNQIS